MEGEFGRLAITWNIKINKNISNKKVKSTFVQLKNKYHQKTNVNGSKTCENVITRLVSWCSCQTLFGQHANFINVY